VGTIREGRLWAGVDVGKAHHWVCVVDEQGHVILSRKVSNDEGEIAAVITKVASCQGISSSVGVTWAVDIIDTLSALLLAMLASSGHDVRYIAGRVVNTMSTAYVGEGTTDAKDAYVIAETARLRRDLPAVTGADDASRELALLAARRADLVADRVRMLNRLRSLLTSVSPVLERAFDYSTHKGALVLLTGYPTPQRLTRMGQTAWRGGCGHATSAATPRSHPARSTRLTPSRYACRGRTSPLPWWSKSRPTSWPSTCDWPPSRPS